MRPPRARRPRRADSDRGDTLIELLCAVVILGLAGVSIMAGFSFLVKSSDIGRRQATGDAHVRSLVEAIQNDVAAHGLKACGGSYLSGANTEAVSQVDLQGYTSSQGAIQSWTGTAWGACTTNGTQRVELTVAKAGIKGHGVAEKVTVILRKPCNGSVASPC